MLKIAMAETTKVTLRQLLDISKTLKNIVCRSFGPRCQATLLATSTDQIMVTTDGIKILKSLNIGHPIGRLIVQAVSSHHKVYADGVKTFILYLTEFLNQLETSQDDSQRNLISVSNLISKFMDDILPKCLEKFKSNGLIVLNSELLFPSELDHYITDFFQTTLTPNLRKNQVKLFSKLFSSVIMNGSNSLNRILDRADLFCNFFDHLHVRGTGPYLDSKTISGIFLRPFSCDFHVSKTNLKFVILRNSIEGIKTTESEEIVRISSEDSLNAAVMSPINVAEDFLKKLNSLGIDLVLMSEKVPQFVVTLCRKYHIGIIDCLDDQDLNLVEMLSITSTLSSVFDEISERNIGQTALCQKIRFGKHVYTNIHFSNCLYVQSFVLFAPTEGLCHELSSLIYKSLKSLQASATGNITASMMPNLVFSQADISDTNVVETFEISTRHFDLSGTICDKHSLSEENISDTQNVNLEEKKIGNSVLTKVSCSLTSIEKLANIKADSSPSVLLLPAGGYFEFQLTKYMKLSTENMKSAEMGQLEKLIFETLISVPRTLHSNLCEKNSSIKRHFVEVLQQVLNSDANLCLNSRGHIVCPAEDCDTLESFNLKMATLCNVLQLVQQLLRLDLIIGVKSLKSE